MKTVKLAWNMLLADGAKSLLLVVQIALFIVLFNICTGTIFTANRLSDKVQNSRLQNAYYCNSLHEEAIPDGFPTYSPQYFTLETGAYVLCADVYSETYLKDLPVRLQYGKMCSALQKDECLLSADAARLLGLHAGIQWDKISLNIWSRNTTNTRYATFAFSSEASGKKQWFAQRGTPIQAGFDINIKL